MRLSVLLVTFLRLRKTIQCLESIGKHTSGEFEMILTDNGSPVDIQKETKKLEVKFPWLRVHLLPQNIGLCLGMEHSFKHSEGEYIVFLNNDMVVTKDWNIRAIKRLKSVENAGCVGLRVIEDGYVKCFYRNIIKGKFDHSLDSIPKKDERVNQEKEVDIVHDGAVVYKREVLEKIEFHPSYFFNLEGFDLMMQTKKLGYKILTSMIDIFHFPSHNGRNGGYFNFRRSDAVREYRKSAQIFFKRWEVKP